ncbi:alpha/beta hydrolase, partial [Acidobacteriia bacterium AH_259_A11_L15]|nr:alpha/beta hydrolase [Acidobacteriia bacterium AH_259_A11_L15]
MPAWIWEHQIEHFSKHYRVVAMDPRSQGESEQTTEGHYPAARARDIKAVVDALG